MSESGRAQTEVTAQERAQFLSTIAQVANLLLRSSDYTSVLPDVVRLLGEAVGCDRCGIGQNIFHPTSGKAAARIAQEWCRTEILSSKECSPHADQLFLWKQDAPFIAQQLDQGKVINCLVSDLPEPDRSLLAAQGNTAELFVPILIHHECWGYIAFDNCCEPRLYDESEIAILKIAADSIAAALERQAKDDELRESQQALLRAEQERIKELASANAALQTEIIERQRAEQVSRGQTGALVRTLNTLAREPVFDHCLGFMLQAIADQFSDRSGGIYLYSEEYETTLLHLNYENGQIQRGKDIQHPCAHTPEPLRQWDDQYMPLLKQRQILIQDVGHYPHNIDRGIKQILVVPLLFGDTFLGNITLRSTRYRQYQPEELELAQALAYQVTLAVQLTRLAEDAKQTEVAKLNAVIAREQEHAALQRAAELAKANEELQQREHEVQRSYRLLSVVAEVTKALLQNSQVEEAIVQAFQRIGEAANISRITLMQEKLDISSGRLQHHVIQEWVASGIPRQMDDPVTQVMYSDEYAALIDELRAGRSIWYVIEDLPEPVQSEQIGIAVKSTGAVPIFIEGKYFGCVGFDDCVDYRQWAAQEVDVLTSSAGAIGAALHRKQLVDRLVAERIQAEQERAAELAKTNQALKNSIDTLATDPDIDRFLGQLLRTIAIQFNAPIVEYWYHSSNQTAYVGMIEWQQQTYTRSQIIDRLPQHPGVTGYCVPDSLLNGESLYHRHRPLYIPNLAVVSELADGGEWYAQQDIQQLLNLPMTLGDESIGAIAIYLTAHQTFTTEAQELAQALTHQATLAVQLVRLTEEAKQAAILEERNRMARDIHDTLAQSLTGVVMQLNAAIEFLASQPDQTQACIIRAQDLARQGLAEARRSVWLLYDSNLNALGLSDSLTRLVEQMTTRTVRIALTLEGTPCYLDAPVNMALLRIAQESLTNALRHAQPQTINLQLVYTPQQVQLRVRDDGCGFDLQQVTGRGLGIVGMRDRAKSIDAQLHIESKLGIGTQTIATVAIASP